MISRFILAAIIATVGHDTMWNVMFVISCAVACLSFSIVNSDVVECPPNEVYSNCSNALCRELNCEQRGIPVPCPGVAYCEKSCVCAYGFLRNSKGVCVEEDRCDVGPSCPENQVFTNCTNGICRHQECYQRSQPTSCPGQIECHTGCVCDVGYLKNRNGNCVEIEHCDY